MKKSLMVVVALLAIAGLMAAMAFSTASVTSYGKFSIVNTDEAMLAFTPGENHPDSAYLTAPYAGKSQKLQLDFDGIQSQSIYTFEELFSIKNNTSNTIEVSLELDPEGYYPEKTPDIFFAGKKLQDGDNGWNWQWIYWPIWGQWVPVFETDAPLTFTLEAGEEIMIDVKLDGDKWMTLGDYDFEILAYAEVVE